MIKISVLRIVVRPRAVGACWALPAAVMTMLVLGTSLSSAEPALPQFETIIDGVIVKPGKAIAKAASSAINNATGTLDGADAKTTKTRKKSAVKPAAKKKIEKANAEGEAEPLRPIKQMTKSGAAPPIKANSPDQPPPKSSQIEAATPAKQTPSWPKTVDEAKAEADAAKLPPATWSEAEVTDAKARCGAILKRIHAVAIAQPPIREGACGAPAPIQLISIGRDPEVSISPPATMTCELAEALDTWLSGDLQPLAKKHFGAEIIKIENMSDYACRNAYGRAKNKLSEHGVANALDIRGFVTSAGKTAYLLEHWGTPQREILARIAAEKAAAERLAAAKLAADKAAQEAQRGPNVANAKSAKPAAAEPPVTTGSALGAPASGVATAGVVDGKSKLTVTLPGATRADPRPGLSFTEPSKLGGPKAVVKLEFVRPAPEPSADSRRAFLHQAHEAACRIFGTTLGPEANAAHRNHFHIDMAPRKVTKICD